MSVEQQKVFTQTLMGQAKELRVQLETLLEKSADEATEKQHIKDALISLSHTFHQEAFINAEKACGYCLEKCDNLSAFGDSDNEEILLRFCLLLEQSLEDYVLGVAVNDELFARFLIELSDDFVSNEQSHNINIKLLKVLRTVYQKQLIQLIKRADKEMPLDALIAISRDLTQDLPEAGATDWVLLEFYLSTLRKSNAPIDVTLHRLLALLDARLAKILLLEKNSTSILPELIQLLESLGRDGQKFLSEHSFYEDKLYVSAGVYARFVDAVKDSLVKIHESFERIYIDSNQKNLLIDSLPFLDKLYTVLQLMGFDHLSSLVTSVKNESEKLSKKDVTLVTEEFNQLVSIYWVLESSLLKLWTIRDSSLPLTYDAIQDWTLKRSRLTALNVLASTYRELRERLEKTTDAKAISVLNIEVVNTLKAEHLLAFSNPMLQKICETGAARQRDFTKDELSEILLALEYIANKNIVGGYVSEAIIGNALHLVDVAANDRAVQADNLSEKKKYLEESEALHEDATLLEAEEESESLILLDQELFDVVSQETRDLEDEYLQLIRKETINEKEYMSLLRIVHTLKGNANILGLSKISSVVGRLEDHMVDSQSLLKGSEINSSLLHQYEEVFSSIFTKMYEFLEAFVAKNNQDTALSEKSDDSEHEHIEEITLCLEDNVNVPKGRAQSKPHSAQSSAKIDEKLIHIGHKSEKISLSDEFSITFDDNQEISEIHHSTVEKGVPKRVSTTAPLDEFTIAFEEPTKTIKPPINIASTSKKQHDSPKKKEKEVEGGDFVIAFDEASSPQTEAIIKVPETKKQEKKSEVLDGLVISFEDDAVIEKVGIPKDNKRSKVEKDEDTSDEFSIKFE